MLDSLQLKVSEDGIRILVEIVNAYDRDPHPSWTEEHIKPAFKSEGLLRLKSADFVLEEIGKVLTAHMEKRGPGKVGLLTAFDVLHLVALNLNRLCPFTKS